MLRRSAPLPTSARIQSAGPAERDQPGRAAHDPILSSNDVSISGQDLADLAAEIDATPPDLRLGIHVQGLPDRRKQIGHKQSSNRGSRTRDACASWYRSVGGRRITGTSTHGNEGTNGEVVAAGLRIAYAAVVRGLGDLEYRRADRQPRARRRHRFMGSATVLGCQAGCVDPPWRAVPEHGVEDDQELAHAGGEREFLGFAAGAQAV